ncbi:PP2C family protein-serine/threonine phosphatase [Massilia glaciei]|uniref:Protein phosphatase n=1 Tax=Massilia glaciei TaxID=1524097 RepID=A0A2U2I5F7_9BURK|nr:protein phosphatase 2C domain-containing protein [Massilia glaciei]PWF54991.1 protein phosphatase [Massilia glaciei]
MKPTFDPLQFGPMLDIAWRTCAGADAFPGLENQDNFLLIDVDGCVVYLHDQREVRQRIHGWPPGHARLAVLDGMGGHGRGREAAEAVVGGLLELPACAGLDQLSDQLDALHARLQRRFAPDPSADSSRRPGTTLTLLELRPGLPALLYHVGDSRLYQIAHGSAVALTVDHVPATAYAMAGALAEQAWWHQVHGEHRSQISQAFILGNAFDTALPLSDSLLALSADTLPPFLRHLPDRRAIELQPGAVYALATDGFWACAMPGPWIDSWPRRLARCGDARAMADTLFEDLLSDPPAGLHIDNLTAIVIRVAAAAA